VEALTVFRSFGKSCHRPYFDLLAALGGKTILSEFPELCGVEAELINRSKSKEVADRLFSEKNYGAPGQSRGVRFRMRIQPGKHARWVVD